MEVKKSHLQRFRWSYRILILIWLVLAFQISTQIYASKFNYQDVLGFNFMKIYPFWDIFVWGYKWEEYQGFFLQSLFVGVVIGFGLPIFILVLFQNIYTNTNDGEDGLHDTGRWASWEDVNKAKLIPRADTSESVVVGGYRHKGVLKFLMHSGAEHILTYAPTRSGKGIGLVVPTLLTWTKSCFITDLKGELWALTAGWRKKYAKNLVIKFEPASDNSARWNPLDEIRIGTEYETGDVQNLALLVVNPLGKELDHWGKTAYSLLVGVILHLLYKKYNGDSETACLSDVDKFLSDPSRPINEAWNEMLEYQHFSEKEYPQIESHPTYKGLKTRVHPTVAQSARDMMERPEEEGGSVLSTALSFLLLYRDPIVAENTKVSDFKLKDIMNMDQPVSLYTVTQPNDKDRMNPLIRIIVTMNVRINAAEMSFEKGRPVAHYKNRMLMMLDEFPSLGKLDILQESLAYVAGYGIKCYLITQDLNQLRSKERGYGENETISANCHIQNAYRPNILQTAEYISKMAGNTTVKQESVTTSGKRAGAFLGSVSKTVQHVNRPLLTTTEALRMKGAEEDKSGNIVKGGEMIVFVAGYHPIKGEQLLYFQNEIYSARAAVETPIESDFTVITNKNDSSIKSDLETKISEKLNKENIESNKDLEDEHVFTE